MIPKEEALSEDELYVLSMHNSVESVVPQFKEQYTKRTGWSFRSNVFVSKIVIAPFLELHQWRSCRPQTA